MLSWGARRQYWIIGTAAAIIVLILAGIAFAVFHKAPMCTDGKQNGKEQGVDCGGPCPYLCSSSVAPLQVRFAQAVSPSDSREDVIAYIDNSNAMAALQGARYTVTMYGPSQELLATATGALTIPPATTIPLYIPRAYLGTTPVSQVFVTFASSSLHWFPATKPVAVVPESVQPSYGDTPRVTATIENTLATPRYNVHLVATIKDISGNVIDASSTIVPVLPAQGTASVTFSWNKAFASTPVVVEILPVYGS